MAPIIFLGTKCWILLALAWLWDTHLSQPATPCLVPREGLFSEAWETHKKPCVVAPCHCGQSKDHLLVSINGCGCDGARPSPLPSLLPASHAALDKFA